MQSENFQLETRVNEVQISMQNVSLRESSSVGLMNIQEKESNGRSSPQCARLQRTSSSLGITPGDLSFITLNLKYEVLELRILQLCL